MKTPLTLLLAGALVLVSTRPADAGCCPFCDAPSLMMAEQIQQCDHMLLAQWIGGEKPSELKAGTSRFRVIEIAFSASDRFQKGQDLELPQYIAGSESAVYTLMGPDDRLEDWHSPAEVSQEGWNYLSHIPPLEKDPAAQAERLKYFIPFFEHPDQMVSNDAFGEFAAAPYETVKALRGVLPREKVLMWLQDKKTPLTRLGFYGLLAGLCGRPEDAAVLEQKITVLDAEFRLGIDGVMAGYILLRGEAGLQHLENVKMKTTVAKNAEGAEVKLPFSEVYSAMQTLRFFWTYEPDFLPKERLAKSMQLLLERPELADLVITDLARWKDWSQMDRLMAMYQEEKFAVGAIRRAIVKYMYFCSQEKGTPAADGTITRPETAVRAEKLLAELEAMDPKTVGDARRYLIK